VIVAPESADNNKTNPIGTGPFTFADRVEGDHITLAKNPRYWGAPVALESATFRFIADPTAAFAALQAGDVDSVPELPGARDRAQFQNDPRFRVVIGATEGETILTMNNGKAPLDNVKVREAIAHAIDRKAIIDGAMFGYGTPIGSFLSPANPDYRRSDRAVELRPGEVEGAAGRGRDPTTDAVAEAAAGRGLCPARRRDHRAAAQRRRHQDRDHQPRMGAVAERGVQGQELRPDHHLAHRAQRHRHFCPRRTTTSSTTIGRVQPDHRRPRGDRRPGKRSELTKAAAQKLADDYAVGFLFELAKVGVENAKLKGMWENAPTQATDLTGVSWEP
jgi:peptide/nickel transport system substrate-binding protein